MTLSPRQLLATERADTANLDAPPPGLPAYAWPGGYPIVYTVFDGTELDAACATELLDADPPTDAQNTPCGWYIHYEGPTVYCAECNAAIPSAYGDPDPEAHS